MRLFVTLLIVMLTPTLVACSSLGYYSQIVSGHMKIVIGKKPVDEVLADDQTDQLTRHRLVLAQRAKTFAVAELGLPDNDSYTSYYDTGRDYVTWNVIAAGEFSLKPKQWCFPVAGCVSYRGYYSRARAQKNADHYAKQGLDVTVTGATAYSTLGWFNDPLLNTILNRSDASIVSLIFHELAHQKLYVKDDSTFNESFATFVERAGLQRWQQQSDNSKDENLVAQMDQRRERRDQFLQLLTATRQQLVQLYDSDQDPEKMRASKQRIFSDMRLNYERLKGSWDGYRGYDGWFNRPLNNARLVAVGTYNNYVPAFAAIFESVGGDFERFYAEVRDLADLSLDQRRIQMQELLRISNSNS